MIRPPERVGCRRASSAPHGVSIHLKRAVVRGERAARIQLERDAELLRLAHNAVYPGLLQHFPNRKGMIRSFYCSPSYERDGGEEG